MYGNDFNSPFDVNTTNNTHEIPHWVGYIVLIMSLLPKLINGIMWLNVFYNTVKTKNKIQIQNNISILILDSIVFVFFISIPDIIGPRDVQLLEEPNNNDDIMMLFQIIFGLIIPIINIIILNHMNKKLKNSEEKEEK